MIKNLALLFFVTISLGLPASEETNKVLCELEGNYSITYEDFRRNYFNEAVEIAKNVAVTTTQSIFFLNRAKETLNKDGNIPTKLQKEVGDSSNFQRRNACKC